MMLVLCPSELGLEVLTVWKIRYNYIFTNTQVSWVFCLIKKSKCWKEFLFPLIGKQQVEANPNLPGCHKSHIAYGMLYIYIYIHILTNESPLFSKQYILNPRVPELSEHTHKYTHMCNSCCLPPVLDHSQLITHIFSSTLSVTLFCLSFSYVPLLKLHHHTLCLLCLVRNVRTCAL